MAKRSAKKFPDRKISETFLDFASPLLNEATSERSDAAFRNALRVCFTAWNAVVFADVKNDGYYLEKIRSLTSGKPETALLMEQMIARKRTLFDDDARLIGDWHLTRTEDGFNLRADARDPYGVTRERPDHTEEGSA